MTSWSLIKSIKAIQHSAWSRWGQRRTGTVPPVQHTLQWHSNLEPMGIELHWTVWLYSLLDTLTSTGSCNMNHNFTFTWWTYILNVLSLSWPWCKFHSNFFYISFESSELEFCDDHFYSLVCAALMGFAHLLPPQSFPVSPCQLIVCCCCVFPYLLFSWWYSSSCCCCTICVVYALHHQYWEWYQAALLTVADDRQSLVATTWVKTNI